MLRTTLLIFLTFWSQSWTLEDGDSMASKCPAGCYCDEKKVPDHPGIRPEFESVGLKIDCFRLTSGTINFAELPENTIQLDLAKHGLSEITEEMFIGVPNLLRLDLQNNNIVHVDEGSFANLKYLKVLDISQNKLNLISMGMLEGLENLERLRLNDNSIQALETGAFEDLDHLSKLDISENPFICDCNIAWFLKFLKTKKNLLIQSTKTRCALPIHLSETPLIKIVSDELICSSTTNLIQSEIDYDDLAKGNARMGKNFELHPLHNQIVMRGDSFRAICRVQISSSDQKIKWHIRGKPLQRQAKENVTITSVTYEESNIIESSLKVLTLTENYSGEWECILYDQESELDRRFVNILVLSNKTKLCQPKQSKTSKGVYDFGAAIGGHTIQKVCQKPLGSQKFGMVYHLCQSNGIWASNVNTTLCDYTSQVTATLSKFANMNQSFTFNTETLISSAKHFLNFTSNPNSLQNKMDIVFYVRAVENYLPFVEKGGELGHFVITMIQNIMDANSQLLQEAQVHDKSCNRLLVAVTNVTLISGQNFQHHTNQLAVEKYRIHPLKFEGVTCTWYSHAKDNAGYHGFAPRKVFHCSDTNKNFATRGKIVLSSIAVSKAVFFQMSNMDNKRGIFAIPIAFAAFSNSSFFPDDNFPRADLGNSVIGVNYFGKDLGNLTDSIVVVIRTENLVEEPSRIQPVWWDKESRDGLGSWNPNYCRLINFKANLIWFSCNRLGFYSFRILNSELETGNLYEFRYHHPIVYVGAVVSLTLILAAIVVFSLSYHSILMNSVLKHCLINMWSSQAWILLVFCTGIYQTQDSFTCRTVGIILHYLTLSNLIWLVLSINVIFLIVNNQKQRQTRRVRTQFLRTNHMNNDHALNDAKVKPISLIRYYLLGWGVSILICGVSTAIDISSYSQNQFCFMQLTLFLATVILPGALMTALMIGFALSAWCIVSSAPSHITEHFEDEAMDANSTTGSSSATPDKEKTTKSLILAHAYIYVLFLSSWMCGSLAVVQPLKGTLPQEELLFSVLFAISSISLGVFIFVYFCASRMDVQQSWQHPLCFYHLSTNFESQTDGEDANLMTNNPMATQPGLNQDVAVPQTGAPSGAQSAPPSSQYQDVPHFGSLNSNPGNQYQMYTGAGNSSSNNYGGIGRNYGRLNDIKSRQRKDSEGSSGAERLSLNNMNHLRRQVGCVAPVNSDAEYGLFGGPLSNASGGGAVNFLQPKTSSPAAGATCFNDDITLSPLGTENKHKDLSLENARNESFESQLPNDYTESSTIKVGAPCQLATTDISHFDGSKLPPGFGKPPNTTRNKGRRHREDDEEDETRSKFSGVSSSYSGRSGGKNRQKSRTQHKRPNRKRNKTDPDSKFSQNQRCKQNYEEDYLGDEDNNLEGTLDRMRRRNLNSTPTSPGLEHTEQRNTSSSELKTQEINLDDLSSQCEMPSKETSV